MALSLMKTYVGAVSSPTISKVLKSICRKAARCISAFPTADSLRREPLAYHDARTSQRYVYADRSRRRRYGDDRAGGKSDGRNLSTRGT